jgi:hypothetical protein
MKRFTQIVSFTASADSAAFTVDKDQVVVGVRIPASFGATSIVFLSSDTLGGTYDPEVTEDGTAIGFTTSATVAQKVDLSNSFPLSLPSVNGGGIKLRAGSSITKDVIVYTVEA